MGSGSEGGEREREGGREGERESEREERKERERGGGERRGVKYQSTSEVLATFNCYTLGISIFDVSCFTTQTVPLMYPDYTGKAHPSLDFFYADTLASHTLLASYRGLGRRLTRFILLTVANIHKYLLDYREGIPPTGRRCLLLRIL